MKTNRMLSNLTASAVTCAILTLMGTMSACTDQTTGPDSGVMLEPELAARAFTLEIDRDAGTVHIIRPRTGLTARRGGPSFALLNPGDFDLLINGMYASFGPKGDTLIIQVGIVNRFANVDLLTPTFPRPPVTSGIILAGIAISEDPSVRAPKPLRGWQGRGDNRWDVLTGARCGNTQPSCAAWSAVPELGPLDTSESVTIAYFIPGGLGAFSSQLYLVVAADLGNRDVPPNDGVNTGAIAGVVNGETTGPLAGVTVSIHGTALSTTTDARGMYALDSLPAGDYTLAFSGQPAYCDGAIRDVTVDSDQVSQASELLRCYGSISGRVTALDGPVGAATIASGAAQPAFTNAQGTYGFNRVPAGPNQVRVAAGRGTCPEDGATEVTITAGQTATVDIALNCRIRFATLTGLVRDAATGTPMAGVQIVLNNGRVTFTAGNGSFAIPQLLLGTYVATVSLPSQPWCSAPPVAVTLGATGALPAVDAVVTCVAAPVIADPGILRVVRGRPVLHRLTTQFTAGIIFQTASALPLGMSLSLTGMLSGIPQATGTFTIDVVARDMWGRVAARQVTIIVAPF